MGDATTTVDGQQEEALWGTCPYCLAQIDVHFDIKGRPYWRCGRCDLRTFGTRTALTSLQTAGWIWSGERPLQALRAWLRRVAVAAEARENVAPGG